MLFAAYYFGSKKKLVTLLIPIIVIVMFVLHPVGKQVWFFSLYWTIPIIIRLLPEKISANILLKSLGSTFTAHSVGGVAFIYAVPTVPSLWIALIPIVAAERILFALGIAISYKAMNLILNLLVQKFDWKISEDMLKLDKVRVLS